MLNRETEIFSQMFIFKVFVAIHLMIDEVENVCIVDLQEVAEVEKREQPNQSLQKCSVMQTAKFAWSFFFNGHLPHPGVKAIDGDVHVFSLAKTSKPGNWIHRQLVTH